MKTKTFLVILLVIAILIGLEVLWTYYRMQTTFGICWVTAAMFAYFAWVMFREGKKSPGQGYWLGAVLMSPLIGFFIWSPFNYFHIQF